MQTVLPGANVISHRAAAVLVGASLWFAAASVLAEFSTSALTDFLTGRIAPEVSEFGEIRMTREDVAGWLEKARTAPLPHDRGIAIANLQNCAWVLLDVPATKPAALELLNVWVLPNVTLLRSQPRTSACSWENVVTGAYACYKRAGDPQRERGVLELLSTQARDPAVSASADDTNAEWASTRDRYTRRPPAARSSSSRLGSAGSDQLLSSQPWPRTVAPASRS